MDEATHNSGGAAGQKRHHNNYKESYTQVKYHSMFLI